MFIEGMVGLLSVMIVGAIFKLSSGESREAVAGGATPDPTAFQFNRE